MVRGPEGGRAEGGIPPELPPLPEIARSKEVSTLELNFDGARNFDDVYNILGGIEKITWKDQRGNSFASGNDLVKSVATTESNVLSDLDFYQKEDDRSFNMKRSLDSFYSHPKIREVVERLLNSLIDSNPSKQAIGSRLKVLEKYINPQAAGRASGGDEMIAPPPRPGSSRVARPNLPPPLPASAKVLPPRPAAGRGALPPIPPPPKAERREEGLKLYECYLFNGRAVQSRQSIAVPSRGRSVEEAEANARRANPGYFRDDRKQTRLIREIDEE